MYVIEFVGRQTNAVISFEIGVGLFKFSVKSKLSQCFQIESRVFFYRTFMFIIHELSFGTTYGMHSLFKNS